MMRIECPISGERAEKCNWITRDGSVRDCPSTGVIECKNCQIVTHSSDLSQGVNYENGTMHDWATGYGDSLPGPATDIARRVASIKDLEKKYKFKSILDFGCGNGGMINALSTFYRTSGIEPDLRARGLANQSGSKVYESAELALADGVLVDVITLFHVVEHFYDPTKELVRIHNLLKPGGLVIIETPNSCDALLTTYGNSAFQNFTYWSHHPMLHSHKSLQTMVERNKFTILENIGTQRYDLSNHLYWLAKGLPGGHEVWSGMLSGDAIESYARSLEVNKTCDTLWLVAKKKN
jgi:2-polyprenyl-3-methyl-5-hydroxy-6-metoxy-1,4-benzoquinol methylase